VLHCVVNHWCVSVVVGGPNVKLAVNRSANDATHNVVKRPHDVLQVLFVYAYGSVRFYIHIPGNPQSQLLSPLSASV